MKGLLALARPLCRWFTSYPVLLVVAIGVVGLCWHVLFKNVGIPDLFWNENSWVQLVAGVGLGLLSGDLGAAGALLSGTRGLDRIGSLARRFGLNVAEDLFLRYLGSTSLVVVAACSAGFLRAPTDARPWPLPLGAFAALFVFTTAAFALGRRLGTARLRLAPRFVVDRVDGLPADVRPFHCLAYYYVLGRLLLLAAFGALYGVFGVTVPVALTLCVFLGLVASTYGFLRFNFPETTFGVGVSIAGLWVLLQAFGGHRLEGLDYKERRAVQDLTKPTESAPVLLDNLRVLEAWSESLGTQKVPLVVIAVDGGGSRAALWSLTVLQQLEADLTDFSTHTRVVAGASGGMLGAAAFVATLAPPGDTAAHRDVSGRELRPDDLAGAVGADFLAPVVRQLFFVDFLIPPFLHPTKDRGSALDATWEDRLGVLGQPYRSLAAGEAAGWRPSLVTAPFIVEDGRRLLISNLDLSRLAATSLPTATPASTIQSIQFFPAFGHEGLKLSTALRLNAAFPYLTPATELPTDPARRVMDGGYYDEHGVDLTAAWVWNHRDFLRQRVSGVALVQIPDSRARQAKENVTRQARPWWVQGFTSIFGPLEAVLRSRDAAMAFRNDGALEVLASVLNTPERPDFFRTFVFEPVARQQTERWIDRLLGRLPPEVPQTSQDVALSWRLTRSEIAGLREGMKKAPNCAERLALSSWWTQRGGRGTAIVCSASPSTPETH